MSRLAIITLLDARGGDIDNSLPGSPVYPSGGFPIHPVDPGWGCGGIPPHPSHGLPGGGYPSQGLPGGGHISLLPVFPFDPTRPDNSLPGSQPGPDNSLPGSGGSPDNSLPPSGHPGIVPGAKFVVKWLACQGLIMVPDNSLPATPSPK